MIEEYIEIIERLNIDTGWIQQDVDNLCGHSLIILDGMNSEAQTCSWPKWQA